MEVLLLHRPYSLCSMAPPDPAARPAPPCPDAARRPQLVSAGRVFEVLRWAEEWKARADPSLVRHLVFGVLEVAAPPYSPEFAASMLR